MTGHGAKFGRKKEEAIAALLSQRNMDEAARVTGIAPKTLRNWLKLPEFQEEYRTARREAVSQSGARMQQNSGAAVTTILKLMTDPTAPAAVRLRAAESVVAHAVKVIELEDTEVRLSELERAAAESNRAAGGASNRSSLGL